MFDRITLEMSPGNGALTENTCRAMLTGWQPLLRGRSKISILVHTDGLNLNTNEQLRRITECFKRAGHELYPDAALTAGAAFDVAALFNEYRAQDAGGLLFSEYLGKQASLFVNDTGIDFLCLSAIDELFTCSLFCPEDPKGSGIKAADFWKRFRAGCPDVPVETRVCAGLYAYGAPLTDPSDGSFGILPPPNRICAGHGPALAEYMTRICAWPGREFSVSCWNEGGSALYLAASVSRIAADGTVETADTLNIACADVPPDGLMPLLLKAENDAPDSPGPIVWVYPAPECTDAQALREMRDGDRFIMDCINGGLPLSCVIASDRIEQLILLKGCVLICPECLAEQVRRLSGMNGVISYSGTDSTPQDMLDALARTGYSIKFIKATECDTPKLAYVRHDNGFMFFAVTPDSSVRTVLSFPQGAPVMTGCACEATPDGTAYTFSAGEHLECRVFVSQAAGTLSAEERIPAGAGCRRCITVYGLIDAFVRFYPEKENCRGTAVCAPGSGTPVEGWRFAEDEMGLTYMYHTHVNGDVEFRMV